MSFNFGRKLSKFPFWKGHTGLVWISLKRTPRRISAMFLVLTMQILILHPILVLV